jgi:hypothetical protein
MPSDNRAGRVRLAQPARPIGRCVLVGARADETAVTAARRVAPSMPAIELCVLSHRASRFLLFVDHWSRRSDGCPGATPRQRHL